METALPSDLETKAIFPMGVARTVTHKTGVRPPIAKVAGDASDRAALEELSEMVAQARANGRMVEALPLDQIDAGHLVRDRLTSDDEDMAALVASIRARGQQTPIEVIDNGSAAQPRYGLISGWRRLAALRQISNQAQQSLSAARILAVIRKPETSQDAYVAMVEENEIRADISFYERARIVVKAMEHQVFDTQKQALQSLFANVSRAKRSKIKSFMTLVEQLDPVLRFPTAISERAGLDLVKRLEADPDLSARLQDRLRAAPPSDSAAEQMLLAADYAAPAVPTGPDAAPVPAATEEMPDVKFDPITGEIRICGPQVDVALQRALQGWLRKRYS
ncbi:hypothetical protein BFP70_05195 [Thioclava sp. SK-1]|nr:hypothetical protein BFP70_05195 [Thioclava sp. SK-1]